MTVLVVQAAGLVTIQDLGRPGHMHEGLAAGGALVRGMLIEANRAAGNADDAAAIEVLGKLVVRAERETVTSRGLVRAGGQLTVESEPLRVAYLAIRGGVDAPLVLGSRATQRSAGIGALIRAGDRISDTLPHAGRMPDKTRDGRISDAPDGARVGRMPDAPDVVGAARDGRSSDTTVRVIVGPDGDAFASGAIDVLVAESYRVLPTSDRVGVRLLAIGAHGAGRALLRVAEYRDRSRPMVRGAIEVPPDGQPIVLGPEHPTTGGYPIVAVVAHDELDRVFAIRAGDVVRFHT